MKLTVLAVIVGFLLDCILGDPASLPHPIILIGKGISLFEKKIRPRFPKTEKGELASGAVLAAVIPIATGLVTFLILFIACKINKWLYFALCCIIQKSDAIVNAQLLSQLVHHAAKSARAQNEQTPLFGRGLHLFYIAHCVFLR